MAPRPTTLRYSALAWLTLAAALAYLCRNAIGVAESSIRSDLRLTLQESGWFMGSFFWSYALFQVPSGWFAQRLGTRLSLTIFAVVWSIATLGIGLAHGFWTLIVAQLVMGISQAGIFPASCDSIKHWFPISQRSLACGILAAGMQMGAIAASGLTGPLMAPFGWRGVFVLFALPGLLWAVWFFVSFRNQPEECLQKYARVWIPFFPYRAAKPKLNEQELELIRGEDEPNGEQPEHDSLRPTPKPTSSSLVVWFLCGQQICRAGGYMFFASWFPTFLQATRGFSIETSGYLQGLVLGGTLVGSLLGGVLTDWIWRRTSNLRLSRSGVGAIALSGCGVLVLGAWFVEDAAFAIGLLTLGSLFAALAGPPAFAAIIDIGGKRVPQLMGLVNMSGNLAAAACPILVGELFNRTANWNLVLLLFAGIYLAGGVCWLFVNPLRRIAPSNSQ